MKTFEVQLSDGRTVRFKATTYHLDGDQYVFETGKPEVEFVVKSEVVSIREITIRQGPSTALR